MIARSRIADLLNAAEARASVAVKGWVRTMRESRDFCFVELNDGSCLANMQIIVDSGVRDYAELVKLTTGAALAVEGALVASPGRGQRWEVRAESVEALGGAGADYPLQKKRHSDEYLRTIAHLRPRSNKYGAIFRLRSKLAYATHRFFHERDFHWVHTPIITGSDCEGAGEMFRVTTLDPARAPLKDGAVDYTRDFFKQEAGLTVSGQLSAEALCLGLGNVYAFGPTFRAENSNTSRHISEFWMIEPEMAFANLQDNMALGQALMQYLARYALAECAEDLALFAKYVDQQLLHRLRGIVDNEFTRLSYTEAIRLLEGSGQPFEFPVEWGRDLQAEHERFLTEVYFKHPVIVYDYPKDIKAFYMRLNDDLETVAAMDLLVPVIGEIIGGSQREERYEVLRGRIRAMGFAEADYWWYLDTRKYGSVPHAGFGLGFERLLMLFSGIANIRDVIPFPRAPGSLAF